MLSAVLTSFFSNNFFARIDFEIAVYGAAAALFWFIPLLNRLHVESMAVLAAVAFFNAGAAAYRRFSLSDYRDSLDLESVQTDPGANEAEVAPMTVDHGRVFAQVLRGRLVRLGLPLGMLTFAMLWAPNCDYFRGVVFAPLFPGITVILAVSCAYLASAFQIRFRYVVLGGIAACLAGVVFDIGFHPQFFSYNHIFGGVLGPLYDEQLTVRPGLFWFRTLTLLWAALMYLVARRRLGLELSLIRVAIVALGIGVAYLFSAQLGFNTPSWYLESRLAGERYTQHFVIHYDLAKADSAEVERWAEEHEFRYASLRDRLGIEIGAPIHSYVYPDESVRASLTGARYTSVAPVWLSKPQVHVLADQIGNVFAHELSHVFSREFGMPLLNASLSVGLIEGFAVATEPPDGRPSPHDMVVASKMFRESAPEEIAARMAATLSPSGFWTGRGAVSYTVSGSFVAFLLDRYGVERFKRAYPYGSLMSSYGRSAVELASEWVAFLTSLELVDRSAAWRAGITFSVPSLFERSCPHWTSPFERKTVEASRRLEEGNVDEALAMFEKLIRKNEAFLPARVGWARAQLAAGAETQVRDSLVSRPRNALTTTELGLLADAYALAGQVDSALVLYENVRTRYPQYARDSRAVWALRKMTAWYPDIVRVLVSADSIGKRRIRLSSVMVEREIETTQPMNAGILWQALLAAEDRDWSDAQASLAQALTTPGGPCSATVEPDVAQRCVTWAAEYAFRAGDLEAGIAYAKTAGRIAAGVGDLAWVRVMKDTERKYEWLFQNRAAVTRPGEIVR